MARRPRIHKPNTIYHVMLRGNDGQHIFFSEEDRLRMCFLLQEGCERFGHFIHSFCFMSNHIHLAMQVGDISISRVIQNLAFRYTRYINKKHNRIGHLFQGRFRSIMVVGKEYLKELLRYIHLNPVRSFLTGKPEEYLWSSHRAYLMQTDFVWLTRDNFLSMFGVRREESVRNYEAFVLKGIGIEPEFDFKCGTADGILGDGEVIERFLLSTKKLQKHEILLSELVTHICERFNISEEALRSPSKNRKESFARSALALFVRESQGISIEELALVLRREPSGLSKLANRLERNCLASGEIALEIEQLRKCLSPPLQMSECQA